MKRRVDLVPLQKAELRQSVRDEEVLMNQKSVNVRIFLHRDVVHHSQGDVDGHVGSAHSGAVLHEQGRIAVGARCMWHVDSSSCGGPNRSRSTTPIS